MAITLEGKTNGAAVMEQPIAVLEQLIARGLEIEDSSKIQQIINVLLQATLSPACFVNPTHDSISRTRSTLQIIRKHGRRAPKILSQVSDLPIGSIPLYKALLPRLIYAGTTCMEMEGLERLSEEFVDLASFIIRILGHELPEEGADRGSSRAEKIIRALGFYLMTCHPASSNSLWGYEELRHSPLSCITVTKILAAVPSSHTLNIQHEIKSHIISLTTVFSNLDEDKRAHFTNLVSFLLNSNRLDWISNITIEMVAGWQASSALDQLLKNIRETGEHVDTAWCNLYSRRHELDPDNPSDGGMIHFLLTARSTGITVSMIEEALADKIASWRDAVEAKFEEQHLMVIKGLRSLNQVSSPSRKRKREDYWDDAYQRLKSDVPNVDWAQGVDAMAQILRLAPSFEESDRIRIRAIFTNLVCASLGFRNHEGSFATFPGETALDVWASLHASLSPDMSAFTSLSAILDHSDFTRVSISSSLKKAWEFSLRGLRDRSPLVKRKSGFQIEELIKKASVFKTIPDLLQTSCIKRSDKADPNVGQIAFNLSVCGAIAKSTSEEMLGAPLGLLIEQLGAPKPVVPIAYNELLSLAKYREKTPYNLISPHMERISCLLASHLISNKQLVSEALAFIGFNRQNFFLPTLRFTVPSLVLQQDQQLLSELASICKLKTGMMLLDESASIFAKIFLAGPNFGPILDFFVKTMRTQMGESQGSESLSAVSLMRSCMVAFMVLIVIELGDSRIETRNNALRALQQAHQYQTASTHLAQDLGTFLKPYMLGIISSLNDALHDLQGKKTVAHKQKLIRSLRQLIETIGNSMSAYSPQIIASLQSTLGIPELRFETLSTWGSFVDRLKYADVGPFVGRTSAAVVSHWTDFTEEERRIAVKIVSTIADSAKYLSNHLDEIVDMSEIAELRTSYKLLSDSRRTLDFAGQVTRLLDRVGSKNSAVSGTAFVEFRKLLNTHQIELGRLSQGDSFQPLLTNIITSLLSAAVTSQVDDKSILYECLGIIGAIDPDRLAKPHEKLTMIITHNFTEIKEASEFAVHLIRDVLVDAFKATNDTRHQNHLAYAIQELLRFCGFDPRVLHPHSSLPLQVTTLWKTIPKDQHETLAPLLESRFSLTETPIKDQKTPIYPNSDTYREWLQNWTTDLLGRIIQRSDSINRGARFSQTIFSPMRGIFKYQDTTVAYHLLPHLVLHNLLSGDENDREIISNEIRTVLEDQVNPSSLIASDKRILTGQVVFDLMDHLSKWLRVARTNKSDRQYTSKPVDYVLNSVDLELTANAALKSRAYARSLKSFEERMINLKSNENRQDHELQVYYERLHEIYADLDEPDGMEGVSAFVYSPNLEHQIREHESTGKWTSAQSCWEVRLQQSPQDLSHHIGLLKCLRNLGHYDTLRTHIRGILSLHPDWKNDLAPFESEAAWIIGDWDTVTRVADAGHPMAKVMSAVYNGQSNLVDAFKEARLTIGGRITSNRYPQAYESILQLQIIREIEDIIATSKSDRPGSVSQLTNHLAKNFEATAPAFQVREALLSSRRTAFKAVKSPALMRGIGKSWILSSKTARKAGYEQSAYSAALQAAEAQAPFAFVQQAKLTRNQGGALRAVMDLESATAPLLQPDQVIDLSDDSERFVKDRSLAKAVLLQARWSEETDRFPANAIIARYTQAIQLADDYESPYYHLGRYYDNCLVGVEQRATYNFFTCLNYTQALKYGVKYIYRTMPRSLTIWLDLGDLVMTKENNKNDAPQNLKRITSMMDKCRSDLPTYQFLTAYPQIASRLGHKNDQIRHVLIKMMAVVLMQFPRQALWPMVYLMQSNRPERAALSSEVTRRAGLHAQHLVPLINDAEKFSANLLKMTNETVEAKKREMSLSHSFKYMTACMPTKMMIPLQDALTGSLPASSENVNAHNPFPSAPVEIRGMDDKIDIMPSVQRPKKIVLLGSDGKTYPFLCKPHDDLRKDARLMDFNSMINKLLKSASESRRRQLYIRTYAVMPLNEECGLIEWVSNTNALKTILEKGYARHHKKIYSHELHTLLENSKKGGPAKQIQTFTDQILPMFRPTVFFEWFLNTWPEPSAWLSSRMAYSRTLAVMSMIGYVLGLGDRHGENILFDGLTGDTVHVDLNCLFDKGKTFEIPERVPFRLTHNMVAAMGVTGIEGMYRKAAEIALQVLRTNSESLMSVLEAFVHDPLGEWTKSGRSKSEKEIRAAADKSLKPIQLKLRGIMDENVVVSVSNQVETLITQAIAPANLGLMYQGWAPWL